MSSHLFPELSAVVVNGALVVLDSAVRASCLHFRIGRVQCRAGCANRICSAISPDRHALRSGFLACCLDQRPCRKYRGPQDFRRPYTLAEVRLENERIEAPQTFPWCDRSFLIEWGSHFPIGNLLSRLSSHSGVTRTWMRCVCLRRRNMPVGWQRHGRSLPLWRKSSVR
jgi:hypothetical protein